MGCLASSNVLTMLVEDQGEEKMARWVGGLLVLLLTLLPLAPATAHRDPSVAQGGSTLTPAARDEAALLGAHPDPRDLLDLGRRFRMQGIAPLSPYSRSTAPIVAVGHVASFFMPGATSGYTRVRATLVLKTPHAYWYVGPGADPTFAPLLATLRLSAREFETHIYPTVRAAFGPEVPTGPDRDPRVTVLFAAIPGGGSFYSTEDLYPRSVSPYSNERKLIYIDISLQPGTSGFASALAHNFKHMIRRPTHELVPAWIRDGSATLAEALAGYTPQGITDFAASPATPFDVTCYGPPACTDATAYFGATFQWFLYVYQQYGQNRALRALLDTPDLNSITAFDGVLARLGSRDHVRDVFARWLIANYLDNPALAGGRYGYTPAYAGCCISTQITSHALTYPFAQTAQLPQFGAAYIDVVPGASGTLHLQFRGAPTVPLVPNTPLQEGMEWWSNRGDKMDSTLTHAFDLSGVRRATLRYDIWYETEPAYDYGYVAVSTDGGQTWRTLPAQSTTTDNPNGVNIGNGYTGSSALRAGNKHGWLHEQVDLSPYARRQVLVRFEHVTDDSTNLAGITLDNIRIPEIGFADAPGAPGWVTHGWVRVANVLPTHWLVQVIRYTHRGVNVRSLPVAADGSGQATLSGLGHDVQPLVVVIAPTAPQSTISSTYTLLVR